VTERRTVEWIPSAPITGPGRPAAVPQDRGGGAVVLLDPDALRAHPHHAVAQQPDRHPLQIPPVDVAAGGAELARHLAHRHQLDQAPLLVADLGELDRRPDLGRVLDAQLDETADGVRPQCEPGHPPGELAVPLVHLHLDAGALEGQRGGQPTDAAAHDDHPVQLGHSLPFRNRRARG
jgi:hypothetical protein